MIFFIGWLCLAIGFFCGVFWAGCFMSRPIINPGAIRQECAEEYEARINDLRESLVVANGRISNQLRGDIMPMSTVEKIITIQRDMSAAIETDNKRSAIMSAGKE